MRMRFGRFWGEVRVVSECNTIQAYPDAVAEQIRWKRAKPVVLSELEQHLEDQRDTFASEGCTNAEQLAVEEMGDPVSVGAELDRIHRPKPQWGLLALTVLLALAGAGVTAGGVLLSGGGFQRLAIALHPERDLMGSGYEAGMIRKELETAQWIGTGEWSTAISGRPYETTVPGCDGSALLTTLIYKLGWLPFLAVVMVFGVLVVWLLSRCLRQKSQLGKMAALAVILTLSSQAACSVAWNLGFTLCSSEFPLMIGNLSSVVNMGLIGLTLSVFRGESIAQNLIYNEPLHLPRYRVRIILEKSES